MSTKIPKVVADFETTLSGKVSAGATTATLQSGVDSDGNTLADGLYSFTIDRSNSSLKEHFVADLASGTALTNVQSVDRRGNLTSGFARDHRAGANIIISNHNALVRATEALRGQDTLDSTNPLSYDGDPTLSSNQELATVKYVLDNVNGGDVKIDGVIATGNAGETVAAGDILYLDTTDQEWKKADADTSYGNDVQFGVAQGAGTDGNAITNGVLLRGVDTNQSGMTAGATQYISTTAGELTETAPTNDIFVGKAVSATRLIVNFENRITNYVNTNDDVTQAEDLQTQTTSTNTIEVGEADATTKKNDLYQTFVATKPKIRGVKLYKKADTGTFTGTVTVALYADSSGSPTGGALATVTITNADWVDSNLYPDDTEFEAIFSSEYDSLAIGTTYGIQVTTSTADNANHPNLGGDTSGGDGTAYYNNTTDGWTQLANTYLYYKTMEGNVSQVVKTGSDGLISSDLVSSSTAFGTGTKDISSTTTTVIPHGLGRVPSLVKISFVNSYFDSGPSPDFFGIFNAHVLFNDTSVAAVWAGASNGSGYEDSGSSTSTFRLVELSSASDWLTGTPTVDDTNITITWATTNTPTGTVKYVWEAIL